MTQPTFDVIKQFVEEKLAFVQRCGLQLISIEEGAVTCMMPGAGNENHIGTMYAGALFTLAEIPGGALWMANFNMSESYPILKSFRIDYLKPAKGDIYYSVGLSQERVSELSAECKTKGKAEFELEGELKDSKGTVVARSVGLYQLRKH
jgi:thioesterase domain-containing protein